MSTRPLARETAHLRILAETNGRGPVTVLAWTKPESPGATPSATGAGNLVKAKDRAAIVEQLPAEYHAEAEEALRALVVDVLEARRTTSATTKDTSPFPVDEPWPEPVDGAALLDALVALITRYVVLPAHAPEALALFVLHTYVADVALYTPYILVTSPTRQCGKTTLLDLLEHCVCRAWKTDGATAAALYRRIDRDAPTVLLDEIDTRLHGEGGELLRGVLNSGFQRGGRITICVGDQHDVRDFATYSPKVLAGIGRPWDTVTSRSVPIRMQRATSDELRALRKLRGHLIADECAVYRRQALRWAKDHRDALRDADPEVPAELGARQADVWRTLLSVADVADEKWGVGARRAALALHGVAEQEGDYGLLLLSDVRTIVRARQQEGPSVTGVPAGIFTADLLHALREAGDDRPWAEYTRDGKPITPRQLATLLGRFDIKPRNVRAGPEVKKGYAHSDLEPAFKRYLPAEAETSPPHTPPTEALQPLHAPGAAGVADVADKKEGCRGVVVPPVAAPDGSLSADFLAALDAELGHATGAES